ncbi:MAG: ABC transporter substrate-binding protein [Halanaerobiaceae bacterium]
MKKLLFLVLILIPILLLTGCEGEEDETFSIGTTQIVEHPALDSAREGFIEALEEEGYTEDENLEIMHENAQGEPSTANSIAQKFDREDLDLILTISTDSSQSMASVIEETPILITAVTDPVSAELVDSLESPGGNITGTTDINPVKEQLELIKDFIPDTSTVGILYNSGEVNSRVQVDMAQDAAKELDLEIEEATVTNTGEVTQATSSLVDKVDAIYIPTDNTVVSAVSTVLQNAHTEGVPVFGSERGQVEDGAVATLGLDYFQLGKQTGEMAASILEGEDPAEMPIESSEDHTLLVNEETCEELDLEIPSDLEAEIDEYLPESESSE